jgi:hypothetical protein
MYDYHVYGNKERFLDVNICKQRISLRFTERESSATDSDILALYGIENDITFKNTQYPSYEPFWDRKPQCTSLHHLQSKVQFYTSQEKPNISFKTSHMRVYTFYILKPVSCNLENMSIVVKNFPCIFFYSELSIQNNFLKFPNCKTSPEKKPLICEPYRGFHC